MAKGPDPLVIPFFATGLYTHRSQLFSPYRSVGVNVVTYHDAAIDGQDMELTPLLEWQRRPGFSRYCSQAFAANEIPNQFYSVRQPDGTIVDFVDTNQNFSTFTPTAITSLFAKTTAGQGFVEQVGQMSYISDGVDFKKWNGATVSGWGIASPVLAPTVTLIAHGVAFWLPNNSFSTYGDQLPIIVDYNGNFQVAVSSAGVTGSGFPVWGTTFGTQTTDGTKQWLNAGFYQTWQPSTAYLQGQVVVDTSGNLQALTSASGTSGATAPTWGSTLNAATTDGALTWHARGSGTNGDALITSGQLTIQAGYIWTYGYRSIWGHISTAAPLTTVSGPGVGFFDVIIAGVGTADTQCTQVLTVTNITISSNVLTVTFSNAPVNLAPGQFYSFALATATFLNGKTVNVTGVAGLTFAAAFTHANYSAGDSGTASFNGVEIYRNADGGGLLYYTASVPNPGAGMAWSYGDTLPDSSLITQFIAPLNHLNDPPPGAVGSILAAMASGGRYSFSSLSRTGSTVTGIFPSSITSNFGLTVGSVLYILGTGSSFDGGPLTILTIAGIFTHGRFVGYSITWTQAGATTTYGPGTASTGAPLPAGTITEYWQGRLWMAVGNKLYFNAGPDCINGVPEEAWPPGNVFQYSGPIFGITKTSQGLLVWGNDYLAMALGGPQTLSFYPYDLLENFGISSPNCIAQDGDNIWALTTQGQFYQLTVSGKGDEGNYVVDVIQQFFAPPTSYVTMHRNGIDSGMWLGDGTANLLRYSLTIGAWSTLYKPVAGLGAIKSIETSPGVYSLVAGRKTAAGYILARDLTTWQDDGQNYTNCFVTIGNITLTQPLAPLMPVYFIAAYLDAVGGLTAGGPSQPALAILPNEVSGTTGTGFLTLGQPAQEPPVGATSSTTLQQLRWQTDSMDSGLASQFMHHLQIRITFAPENAPNTIKALAIGFDKNA